MTGVQQQIPQAQPQVQAQLPTSMQRLSQLEQMQLLAFLAQAQNVPRLPRPQVAQMLPIQPAALPMPVPSSLQAAWPQQQQLSAVQSYPSSNTQTSTQDPAIANFLRALLAPQTNTCLLPRPNNCTQDQSQQLLQIQRLAQDNMAKSQPNFTQDQSQQLLQIQRLTQDNMAKSQLVALLLSQQQTDVSNNGALSQMPTPANQMEALLRSMAGTNPASSSLTMNRTPTPVASAVMRSANSQDYSFLHEALHQNISNGRPLHEFARAGVDHQYEATSSNPHECKKNRWMLRYEELKLFQKVRYLHVI